MGAGSKRDPGVGRALAAGWIGLAALSVLGLASCAAPMTDRPAIRAESVGDEALTQQKFVIAQRRAEHARVLTIHHRLSAANLEFCKTQSATIGIAVETKASYPKEFATAVEAAGIGAQPTIGVVLEGSPAAAAGVRVGDVVMAIDGASVAASPAGAQKLRRAIATGSGGLTLSIKRDGAVLSVPVTRERICGYPVMVVNQLELNAYADGTSIVLPRVMLRFAASDQELALVLGHEMAHNAMGHLQAQSRNEIAGMIGGALLDGILMATTGVQSDAFSRAGAQMGAAAYSKGFESEADYVGLYFMARAGYDISDVETFWRRMAAEDPSVITFGVTHPTSAERFVALAAARDEIRARQAAGEPLRPRMKDDTQTSPRTEPSPTAPR